MVWLILYLNTEAFKYTFASYDEQEPIFCVSSDYYYFFAFLKAVAGPPGPKGDRVSQCNKSTAVTLAIFSIISVALPV